MFVVILHLIVRCAGYIEAGDKRLFNWQELNPLGVPFVGYCSENEGSSRRG